MGNGAMRVRRDRPTRNSNKRPPPKRFGLAQTGAAGGRGQYRLGAFDRPPELRCAMLGMAQMGDGTAQRQYAGAATRDRRSHRAGEEDYTDCLCNFVKEGKIQS